MPEDDWLEAAYEDANGGDFDADFDTDIDDGWEDEHHYYSGEWGDDDAWTE